MTYNPKALDNHGAKYDAEGFDFDRFCVFCRDNGLRIVDDDGRLTVQGEAVMATSNCIVAAGAGSGKTTVLSFRFLRMVAQGISPDRILTITFTRKATAEMKGRIFSLLRKGFEEGLVPKDAIDRFSDVSISTVDSFCSEIVRASAVHQGVPASFSVMDDEDLQVLSQSVLRTLLKRSRDKDFLEQLYSRFSVERLQKIFLDLARVHLNITKPLDVDSCMDVLCSELSRKIQDDAYERANRKGARKEPSNGEKFFINALEDAPFMRSYYCFVKEYEEELFSRKRTAGALSFNDVMQLAIRILRDEVPIRDRFKDRFDCVMVDEFQDNNDDYRKLIYLLCEKSYDEGASRSYDAEGIPTLDGLCSDKVFLVGDEKQSIYKFRGADVSVFKRLSRELCPSPIELRRNWRSEPAIIHFCNHAFASMMDDGSGESFEASYTPLEPRDQRIPKSRIVLLHPNVSPEVLESHPKDECEANVVARLIADMCSGKADFLVPDDDGTTLRPPRPNEIGLLLKAGTHQASFEKALTAVGVPYSVSEARSLAGESVANDLYSALQACVYPYDRIAYASYLKSPFCSFKDSELQVVLADGYGEGPKDGDADTNAGVGAAAVSVDAAGQGLTSRLARADEQLSRLSGVVSGGCIAKALDYMWWNMGYRDYMLCRTLNRPYAEHYDYLYALAVDFDSKGKTMVDFVDYLRLVVTPGSDARMKEVSVFKESIEGVQIMTVHKSKGLAFKVVVVAGMDSKGSGGFGVNNYRLGDGVFLSYESTLGASPTVQNPIKELYKKREAAMDNAETKRLLYVAATRARYHLVFSTFIDERTKVCVDGDSSNSMQAYLLDSIGYEHGSWEGLSGSGFVLEDMPMDVAFAEPKVDDRDRSFYKAAFDAASVPTLPNGIVSKAVTQLAAEGDGAGDAWLYGADDGGVATGVVDGHGCGEAYGDSKVGRGCVNAGACASRRRLPSIASDPVIAKYSYNAGFGTLVHALIEGSIKGVDVDAAALMPEKAGDDERAVLLGDARSMAAAFMDGHLYGMLEGMRLFSERGFLIFDGACFVEGTIDLLAVGEHDVFVIDFKTDSSCFADDHRIQLGQYAKAAASLYPGRNVRAFVCYLRDVDSYLEL